MSCELEGKKILFFSWPFYQYPDKIKSNLEDLGANVTLYLSAPTDNFLKVRFLEKYEKLKDGYLSNILNEIRYKKFDYVFMINAAVFPEKFISEINLVCKNSMKILYSWDSLDVYPRAKSLYKYFDRVYSFDPNDVSENKELQFLPLFYCDELYDEKQKAELKYDFSFVGFAHTERYQFVKQISEFANEHNYSYFFKLYLPSKIHYFRGKYIKKIFSNARMDDFVYSPVPYDILKKVINQSKIVIDLELGNQTGLTMRTIETHGMRKKLITTNANIKKYDFYNEQNILVVDRKNPRIDLEFVESGYRKLDQTLYEKYTLSNWLRTIFKV